MKGVSIPINTLVMLAVAIIVLLATVAWFMGAFGGAATEETRYQKFKNACSLWTLSNCENSNDPNAVSKPYSTVDNTNWKIPKKVYDAYKEWRGEPQYFKQVATECGCSEPFGM